MKLVDKTASLKSDAKKVLNPHGSDETNFWICFYSIQILFLTHTVQMKLVDKTASLKSDAKRVLNPHGSDETLLNNLLYL